MRLENKVAVVTGAGGGIGAATARAIVAEGGRVALLDVNPSVVEELAAELGDGAAAFEADVTRLDRLETVAAAASERFGGIDALVNNAGIRIVKSFLDHTEEDWRRILDVNLTGQFLAAKAVAPHLIARGKGKIVNVASDTALWGAPRLLHYVASKGAVVAMTRSLARELGNDGIAVNAVAPGLTRVEATEYVPAERHRLYVDGRAMNRAQQPEDVVGAVTFLLSDAADFVTGQTLPVNGGFVFN